MARISDERLKELIHDTKCVEPEGCYHCEEIDMARELLAYRESGALEALKESRYILIKRALQKSSIFDIVVAAIAKLEAIGK